MTPTIRLAIASLMLAALAACAPGPAPESADGIAAASPWRHWQPTPQDPHADREVDRPKAVILALHGFNDYSNAFQSFAAFARDNGVAVHAYDQRGFGANRDRGFWAGTARLTDDLRDAVARLRQIYGETPLYVLGESMGGAVTIIGATGSGVLDVDGLILVAPAVWGGAHLNPFYRLTLWIASSVAPGWALSPRGLDIRPSDNIEMLRAFSADPLVIRRTRTDAIAGLVRLMDQALAAAARLDQDVLLLFGENDEIVPVDALDDFRSRLVNAKATTVRYPDGYHMLLRDLQRAVVFEDIMAWIQRRPLPSAATIVN